MWFSTIKKAKVRLHLPSFKEALNIVLQNTRSFAIRDWMIDEIRKHYKIILIRDNVMRPGSITQHIKYKLNNSSVKGYIGRIMTHSPEWDTLGTTRDNGYSLVYYGRVNPGSEHTESE